MESHENETLSCDAFENRVHQILDDRLTLTGDARLMEHAARCAACEIKLLDYDSFDDSISFLKSSIVDVTCIVDADGSESPIFRPLSGLAALAALLLICFNVLGGASPTRSNQVAQNAEINEAAIVNSTAGHLAMVGSPSLSTRTSRLSNRVTPDSSPFSPNFRVVDNIPRLPSAPDWERVSKPFESLEPVLTYSAELPGIKTIHCTLNVTIELLRRTLSPSELEV